MLYLRTFQCREKHIQSIIIFLVSGWWSQPIHLLKETKHHLIVQLIQSPCSGGLHRIRSIMYHRKMYTNDGNVSHGQERLESVQGR